MMSFKDYYNEGIMPEPASGWETDGKPLNTKYIEDLYKKIDNNWVPIKITIERGDGSVPDHKIHQGSEFERDMTLMDISITPNRRGRGNTAPYTLMDIVMQDIRRLIIYTSSWIDADRETKGAPASSRWLFTSPVDKKRYQDMMKLFRNKLVGFGINPDTLFHRLNTPNARAEVPGIQAVLDELFDVAREVQHYVARPGDSPKDQGGLPGGPQELPPTVPPPPG